MKDFLIKFLDNPIEFTRRVIDKMIIFPLKYGRKDDYDAARYWDDRFKRHKGNVKAVGIEGLSEEENLKQRGLAEEVFRDACQKQNLNYSQIHVLEIGCGTGFYTKILRDLGVKNYTGIDITDAYFPQLQKKFPQFHFVKKDVTTEPLDGTFDAIMMMDVIEHIVTDQKLSFAMNQINNSLKEQGLFFLVPVSASARRHLFHVRQWSLGEIERLFPLHAYRREKTIARKDDLLLVIQKKSVSA